MTPVAAFALLLLLAVAAWWWQRRQRRRRLMLRQLLDAADALEQRLRGARREAGARAGAANDPVREAMQEMLRHRLWLQRHGESASLSRIEQVRDSFVEAEARMRAAFPGPLAS